jgi:hypothetical protein
MKNETSKTSSEEATARVRGLWGVLVEFENAESLLPAVERVRDAGFKKWDVHSPLPLHGLDDAMGLEFTRLPWVTLAAGIAGVGAALLLQWYTNAFDYPIIVSGKPLFSLPANIPVTFELAVLFAAVATVGGLFALNGLPLLYHPLFRRKRFRRVTSDRFFITIEAADPKFDPEGTVEFLETLGGTAIEKVEA